VPHAICDGGEYQRGNPEAHQRQVFPHPLAVLHVICGFGGGDEYRPTLVVETQLSAALHFSTVPHFRNPVEADSGTIRTMDTQTIERTDTDERVDDGTDSDTPKYFHYVKKDKIAESAVMGTHVVALCGEVFPVTKAAKPGSPVCPDCKRIYEKLKS
jgi:Protein of unknown function (DUF3039)